MQFDAAFGGAELGPGEKRQAQIYCRGIKGVELVFEAKLLSRRERDTLTILVLKQGLEKLS